MRPRNLRFKSPYSRALIPWGFFVFASSVLIGSFFHLPWLLSLFIGLNVGAFLLYGLDKLLAGSNSQRIPERILWLSAFLGGSIGAIAGMQLFRHKTKKTSFQFVFALLVLLQIALIFLYLKYNSTLIDGILGMHSIPTSGGI